MGTVRNSRSTAHFRDDPTEPGRCRAATKASKAEHPDDPDKWRRCPHPIEPGRIVCRKHGGRGGRPPGSGRWVRTYGKISEMLLDELEDPELHSLDRGLGILSMAVSRSLRRVEERDTPAYREELSKVYARVRAASDPNEMAAHLNELGALIDRGADEDDAFKQLTRDTVQMQRRLEEDHRLKLARTEVINRQDLVAVFKHQFFILRRALPEEYSTIAIKAIAQAMHESARTVTVIPDEPKQVTEGGRAK